MKQIVWRLLAIVALVLLASCGSGGGGAGGTTDDVVVADEVRVLDAAAREDLEAFSLDLDSGAGEVRFAADSAFAASVETGAILVTEPVAGVAPHGFLQRVKAKRTEGDEVVLETEQATLVETFEHAEITFDQPLRPADVVESEALYEGVALRYGDTGLAPQASAGFDFDVAFDEVLVDLDEDEATTDDQLRLDGTFSFAATASGDIDIGWFELERFYAKVRLEESVDVRMRGNLATGFSERVEVARFDFGTFTVMVGPVPVVFVLDMVVSVSAQGQIEAELVASAAQSTIVQVGAEYTDDDGWDDLNEFDSDFDFPTPTITASASASASLQPRVNLKIYGLAGPYAYAEAFVEADAEMPRDPFWRVEAGLDLGVGFVIDLPVVGRVGQWSTETRVLEEEIGRSENLDPVLEVHSPADLDRLLDGSNAVFRVEANDYEAATVEVLLLDGSGGELDDATAEHETIAYLYGGCMDPGTHDFRVRARDGSGATATSDLISLLVENRVPEVTIESTAPAYPGLWTMARASVEDVSCDGTGDPDQIAWAVGAAGEPYGSGRIHYRVPDGLSAGDGFDVTASYVDAHGAADASTVRVQVTELQPGMNLAPEVEIVRPSSGDVTFVGCPADPGDRGLGLYLEGMGVDAETGPLSSSDLEWTLTKAGRAGELTASGTTARVYPCEFDSRDGTYTVFGAYTLELSATDAEGETGTDTLEIWISPEG